MSAYRVSSMRHSSMMRHSYVAVTYNTPTDVSHVPLLNPCGSHCHCCQHVGDRGNRLHVIMCSKDLHTLAAEWECLPLRTLNV